MYAITKGAASKRNPELAGAGELVVIGTVADTRRLQIAEQIGASATLGAKGEDIVEWTRSLRDGYGFDLVIDAAGVSATLKLAIDIVRPAGQISKVGWGPQPFNFSLWSRLSIGSRKTVLRCHFPFW